MLNYLVAQIFDDTIKVTFKEKEEIRKFLLTHEKKQKCIDNVTSEVLKVELQPIKFDQKKLRMLIEDCCRSFCNAALESKRQSLLSSAETKRIQTDAGRLKEIDQRYEEEEKEFFKPTVKVFT